jgi:DNA primase small subunit
MANDRERGRTLEFVKSRFRDYYEKCDLYLPERFGKRAFGFLFFGAKMMQRHLSFGSKERFRDFLVQRVPMHVYHSSAYYEVPDAPTMDEKNWLGADLIFDLDSDHLKGAKDMSYEVMLAEVKREFIKLIENYILDDFGFSKNHVTIVFSGARGYHLHIRDPKIMGLGSQERREIVDFLSPSDESIDEFVFESKVFDIKRFKNTGKEKRIRKMPKIDDYGWKRKMRTGIENLLNELEGMDKDEAIKYLNQFEGIGKATAKRLWEALLGGKIKGADRMRTENIIEVFSSDKIRNAFLRVVVESQKVKLEGEADEPVTSDIKRLIRLPTSLHGKTGLLVKPLKLGELESFDPLEHAIPSSFGSEPMDIDVQKPVDVVLRGEKFNLGRGISKVPEYAAIFFMCRGFATLPR